MRETDGRRLLGLIRDHVEGVGYHIVTDRDPTEEERLAPARLARFDSGVSNAAFRTNFDSTQRPAGVGHRHRRRGVEPTAEAVCDRSVGLRPHPETAGGALFRGRRGMILEGTFGQP